METLFINIGTNELVILFIACMIGLAPLLLAILALIDLFKRDFRNKRTENLLLVFLIIFAPFVGSLIYFIALRKNYPLKSQILN